MVQQNFRFGSKVVIVVIRILLKENNTCDPIIIQQVFIMMQDDLFVLTKQLSQKSESVPVARQQLRLSL
jgi:hypothetical protein